MNHKALSDTINNGVNIQNNNLSYLNFSLIQSSFPSYEDIPRDLWGRQRGVGREIGKPGSQAENNS